MRVMIGVIGLYAVFFCIPASAQEDGLEGAWATDVGACSKIFVRKRGKLTIASNSDAYGSGFIIGKNEIRGKIARCRIERRQRNEKLVTVIAVCSTDIALSTLQFSLRVDGENHITRSFPGMEGMEVAYTRCPPTDPTQ